MAVLTEAELILVEIKSDRDGLRRLAGQAAVYSSVADRAALIVAPRHLAKAVALVPAWWGVWVAADGCDGLRLACVRGPRVNVAQDPVSVARLLWRAEALAELKRHTSEKGLSRLLHARLCARLGAEVPLAELRAAVYARLRARTIGCGGFAPTEPDANPGS